MIITVNPFTEKPIKQYEFFSAAQIQSALTLAKSAQTAFADTDFDTRSDILKRIAANLRANKIKLATLMTEEMGKPLLAAGAEIDKCTYVCEHYANFASEYLAPRPVDLSHDMKARIQFEPLGVIFAIMPWNFPFWQVFRFAAPNLMAGNGIVLKHAPNTTGCGLAIETLMLESGLPAHVFSTVVTDLDQIESIIASPNIAGVTLTGSQQAGRSVAECAGRHLKKCILELGGSDPYIVLKDANVDLAVNACSSSRFLNSGQTCIAAKRWIVEHNTYETFKRKATEALHAFTHGDPKSAETKLGPLARLDLLQTLKHQVDTSIQMGAKIVHQEKLTATSGYFYPVTLLENITPDMPVFREELFGPVAVLIEARDEHHALEIANQCEYGLGSAVFTANPETAKRVSARLQNGVCAINDFVKSDPRIPFGGVKNSGFGRELGEWGILEFSNVKTVCFRGGDLI